METMVLAAFSPADRSLSSTARVISLMEGA
jgi:hypothetical protein